MVTNESTEEEESLKQLEPSNKKRANESASKTPLSSKKAKPKARTESKANLKKQKIHKDKSEDNDEDGKIVSRNEIEEMKKSIKELSEAMKKLQESQMTNSVLLEALLKRYHGELKMELKGSAVDAPPVLKESVDAAPVVKESVPVAAYTQSAEDINADMISVMMMSKRERELYMMKEKETGKKKKFTCCFESEDAKGDNYQTIFVKGFERLRPRDEIKSALSNIFSSCGEITRVYVPFECETGVPLGFAFINFRDSEVNEKALKLNGSHIGGRKLKVTMARDREEYSGFTDFNGCDRCPSFMLSRAASCQNAINDKLNLLLMKRKKRVFNR